jgi:siroheme synthase-like protein
MTADRFFPIFIKGGCLECLVVGGGAVAERKIDSLCDAGARVTVVSPTVSARIEELANKGTIRWIPASYSSKHLTNVRFVIGATDDRAVNGKIFRDAKSAGIMVNIVDDPEQCTFIVPSVLTKGLLQIAVSTGGAAPKMAAKIRQELETLLPGEYTAMIDELCRLRPSIKRLQPDQKDRFWHKVSSIDVRSYADRAPALCELIRSALEQAALPQAGLLTE